MARTKKNDAVNTAKVAKVNINPIDELFFADVEKIPAKKMFPNLDFNSYNDTIVKVKTADKEIIVNNCSNGYLLIPNKDVFPSLEKEMEKFGEISIKREVRDNSSFFVTYDFLSQEKKIEVAGSDFIFPRISIQNSYNSKYLFNIECGFFRVVCTNGLCLPVEDDYGFNTILSHCEGNFTKLVNEAIQGIDMFLKRAKEVSEEYELLKEYKISKTDLDSAVESILRKAKALISAKDSIVERIIQENEESKIEYDMFSVYNGINYMLQPHNNQYITANPVDRRKMDEKILDCCFDLVEK